MICHNIGHSNLHGHRCLCSQPYSYFQFSTEISYIKNIFFGQTRYAVVFVELSNFKIQVIWHIGHTYDILLPYYVYPLLGG